MDRHPFVTVTLTVDRNAAETEEWYSRLQALLDEKVPGITFYTQTHGRWLTVEDAMKALRRTVPGSRLHYNGRNVFYWFVSNMGEELVVICTKTKCGKRRTKTDGGCRCSHAGKELPEGGWCYRSPRTPDSNECQSHWKISAASLATVSPEDIPPVETTISGAIPG